MFVVLIESMTEPGADGIDIDSSAQQVCRRRVAYRMRAYVLVREAGVTHSGKAGIAGHDIVDTEPGHRLSEAIRDTRSVSPRPSMCSLRERGRQYPQRAEASLFRAWRIVISPIIP